MLNLNHRSITILYIERCPALSCIRSHPCRIHFFSSQRRLYSSIEHMQAANHLEITCPPCAVDALPPELLWKIFMINTEREDLDEWSTGPWYVDDPDGRLDTARSCSQVCRLWRTLLLQFSSVWGRLLHIADFEHVADAWREVIIERIGDALLWVTGKITNSTRPFIMPILEKKWTNVQILVVRTRVCMKARFCWLGPSWGGRHPSLK
ncbi:hypothetical protein CPC08DRAFT_197283 [Agrocybe pediades]|nr:hypothetical protein CPC08DRAFT_197283 [Agrocybe pediades]